MKKSEKIEEMKDPCWKGYKMLGTKTKGDRTVPNCTKVKTFKEWLISTGKK